MMRHDTPIREYPLRDSVNSGISYSMLFSEWEACHGAGLDLWRWENNQYPIEFKAKVIAWWELHNLVSIHNQDAAAAKTRHKR